MIRAEPLRLLLAAACTALVLASAHPALAQDSRLVTREYNEAIVVTIRGKTKVQTTIMFAPDEQIENVAIGDSGAWQVQPNKAQTILFVKPLAPNATTNMTVVTDKRTYLFDLVSSPRNAPLYVLQFRYPELERKMEEERLAAELAAEEERIAELAQAETEAAQANAIELAAVNDPFAVQDPATFNFEWDAEGDSALFPARTYDNGVAVFLTWPADTPIPAILITNSAGEEGPVNFAVRGETIVLDTVPDQIILRSGGDKAVLTNMQSAAGSNRRAAAKKKRSRGS